MSSLWSDNVKPSTFSASSMSTPVTAAVMASTDVESKIGVMFAIWLASLFAVSFPMVSQQMPFRIPSILFFIGKHFGTGVILATAFIHLLGDAFKSLQSPIVEERYGKIGRWTGLIILGSLLAIFLVEYVSTTYVEHLKSKPSAPPTPTSSTICSRSTSHHKCSHPTLSGRSPSQKPIAVVSENTPLLFAAHATGEQDVFITSSISCIAQGSTQTALLTPANDFSRSRSRPCTPAPHYDYGHHASRHSLHSQHSHQRLPALLPAVNFIEVLTNSPRICRLGLAPAGEHQHHHHQHDHDPAEDDEHGCGRCCSVSRPVGEASNVAQEAGHLQHRHHGDSTPLPTVGRKRQIVGILVLQLGIMIHSLVIGLTLSVASGSDFTSLTTAIIFHQLFEGLSLGIRIAALPPTKKKEAQLQYSDNERTPSESSSNVAASSPRLKQEAHRWRSFQKWKKRRLCNVREVHWLKPTLSFLFAVTTPFGMTLGMVALFPTNRNEDMASMHLIKGVMSAVSAGMLIYAATVEMIAGDFVFGDVEGGHHHHHAVHQEDEGHGHTQPHEGLSDDETHERGRGTRRQTDIEDALVDVSGLPTRSLTQVRDEDIHPSTQQAGLAKRVLAVVSLLMGVGMMIIAASGE